MSIQKPLLCLYQFNIQVIEKIMKFISNFQLHIVLHWIWLILYLIIIKTFIYIDGIFQPWISPLFFIIGLSPACQSIEGHEKNMSANKKNPNIKTNR